MTTTTNQDDNLDDLSKVTTAVSEIIKETFTQMGAQEAGVKLAKQISKPVEFAQVVDAFKQDGITGGINKIGEIASGVGAGYK